MKSILIICLNYSTDKPYNAENTVAVHIRKIREKIEIDPKNPRFLKNVTKYELGENVEELFERFKRGDTSRHTEGSGLRLAIAKSIVDLHEGNLDIEIDGDLFKITIVLNRLLD